MSERSKIQNQAAVFPHLSEKGFIDVHARVGALRQHLPSSPPRVQNGRVGVGDTAQKHRPLKVELFLCLAHALMHRNDGIIQD